jgi:hypothetical protein
MNDKDLNVKSIHISSVFDYTVDRMVGLIGYSDISEAVMDTQGLMTISGEVQRLVLEFTTEL